MVVQQDGSDVDVSAFMFYSPVNSQVIVTTEDKTVRGEYTIKLTHKLEEYTDVTITETLLTVDIIDVCSVENNYIIPSPSNTFALSQTFILEYTTAITIDAHFATDYQSELNGEVEYCEAYTYDTVTYLDGEKEASPLPAWFTITGDVLDTDGTTVIGTTYEIEPDNTITPGTYLIQYYDMLTDYNEVELYHDMIEVIVVDRCITQNTLVSTYAETIPSPQDYTINSDNVFVFDLPTV